MSGEINEFNGSEQEYNDYLDYLEKKMEEESEPQELPEDFVLGLDAIINEARDSIKVPSSNPT